MNSNLFTNALLMPQEPSPNEFSEENPFASWETSNEPPIESGFQADAPLLSSLFPQNPMNATGSPEIPPGLAAMITSAISEYFSQGGEYGTATPFENVTLASTGDPHESINGTKADGTGVKRNWNSMQNHRDLLSAPEVAGGFQLSSQVGAPNAQGATMNSSFTATADHGRTAISFNVNGDASVRQGNTVTQLTPNETMQLGSGLSVTDTGSALRITAENAASGWGRTGGMLTTTLSKNGEGGVDLNAQGKSIVLGGYLVNSSSQ